MKKLFKIIGILLAIVIVFVAGAATYVTLALPDVGPPEDIKIEITPERVERGAYLANHVMLCMDCHGKRDWSVFGGPPVVATMGAGGEVFDDKVGIAGYFESPNLTQAGLKDYTDAELFRAVTCGVARDGRALFPIMPYLNYGQLDPEDIKDVLAYIRTLKPIENKINEPHADFPLNIIMHTIPQKAQFSKKPDTTDKVAYGRYLAIAAGCVECHTNKKNGKAIGPEMAGGFEVTMPGYGVVRSMNLTPHETGIKSWTSEKFVQTFKIYQDSTFRSIKLKPGQFQTIMPWIMYSGMKQSDLEAIFAYLRSVTPVDSKIEKFTPEKAM